MHAALYSDTSLPDFADQAHFVFRHHDEFEAMLMDYWEKWYSLNATL